MKAAHIAARLLAPVMFWLPACAAAQTANPVDERQLLGEGVQLACRQPQPESLDCRYRPVFGGVAGSAQATLAGTTLPAPTLQADPLADDGVLLLLIDTSDPAREQTVAGNVRHALTLIDALPPVQRVGVAAFDSGLRVLAEVGASREQLSAAVRGLHAVGRTTEGYRSALEAVRMLAALPAGRRTLVLFSDGLFEDRAYYHRDVVEAAREAGVMVYALGYARSVSLSVALQTLRRLAEETGGRFSTANPDRPLPSSFVDALLAGLGGGGRILVDLGPGILAAGNGGMQPVRLRLLTANGVAAASVPVEVPAPLPTVPEPVVIQIPVPAPVAAPAPVAEPSAPVAASASSDSPPATSRPPSPPASTIDVLLSDRNLLYLAVGAVAASLALALLVLVLRRRKAASPVTSSPMDTLAFLETADGSTVYAVMSALFRIGRHGDNDLVLNDASISRHHAQLQRHRDGSFSIRNLESLNGVFVNGDQVEEHAVADGDLLEIGDVALRFRSHGASELAGEETVILKTAMPSHPLAQGTPLRRH